MKLIIFIILILTVTILQIFMSRNKNKFVGLIIPTTFLIIALYNTVTLIKAAQFMAYSSDSSPYQLILRSLLLGENDTLEKVAASNLPIGILALFLFIICIIIYFICKAILKKRKTDNGA